MTKPNQLPGLSNAQLEIMNIVWDKGEVTVTEVWDEINKTRATARTTVMTVMVRLEQKGWLRHRAVIPTYIYSATRPRSESSANIISGVLHKVFGGSTENLVMTLLGHKDVSKKEIERVKEAIRKAEKIKQQE